MPPDAAIAMTVDAPPDAAVAVVPLPPRLEVPAGDCTLRGTTRHKWGGRDGLALVPGSPSYAFVSGPMRAEGTFGSTGVFLQVANASVTLSGYADPATLVLHAARPITAGGWLAPGSNQELTYLGMSGPNFAFELTPPHDVKPHKPVRGEATCADLALDGSAKFDPMDAIGKWQDDADLKPGRAIPLSLTAGGKPVATLNNQVSSHLRIFDAKGKHVRVAFAPSTFDVQSDIVVFGWIPRAFLVGALDHAQGGVSGAVYGNPVGRKLRDDTRFVRCAGETALVVEQSGERRTVGSVAAGVVIEVFPGGDELVEVGVRGKGVLLGTGARWLVQSSALARCDAAPRP